MARKTERPTGHLKIGELAKRSGVSRGTIQHYLREGLLPAPVKTHRNMAWYDPSCVDRIRLIKELQERRYLPLSEIRRVVEGREGKETLASALVEGQQAALASLVPDAADTRLSLDEAAAAFDLPGPLVGELARLELITPRADDGREIVRGADLEVLAAVSGLRQAGFTEEIGFSPEDLEMYRRHLAALLDEEVATFTQRILESLPAEEVPRLARASVDGATALMLALRKKLIYDLLSRMDLDT